MFRYVVGAEICSRFTDVRYVYVSARKLVIFLTQYCAGGKIEKNKMGGACGAYGGVGSGVQGVGGET
jgi:hypothetical protein